jgi:hypothetical protein
MKFALPRSFLASTTGLVTLFLTTVAMAQPAAPAAAPNPPTPAAGQAPSTAPTGTPTVAAPTPTPAAPPTYAPPPSPPQSYPPGYYPPPPGYYAPPPGYYPPPPGYYPPPGYPPSYEQPKPVEPPATATHLGLGYKIGNGLGFVGGDLIISPVPHVALDLQASTFTATAGPLKADGYGLAPALHIEIREPGRSTPYIGAGYLRVSVSMDGVRDGASGGFVNGGYEWKWSSGLGIILGGGIGYLGDIRISTGNALLYRDGGWLPMLEAGLRFMVL